MKKILLISDTHGYIDEKILSYCKLSDEVWHAGDIGSIEERITIPTKEEQLILEDINHYKNYGKGSGVFF